jgi:predicted MFS family arabinose efflux permease
MGGISDKLGKEKCFALSAIAIGILMFGMSLATDMVALYTIWFFASIFFTVIINARGTLMAEVVSKDHYTSGNALVLSLLNGAKLLAPLIGGLILMKLNIKVLLYFTSFLYVLVALFSSHIRTDMAPNKDGAGFMVNAKLGFGFLTENKTFRLVTSIAFFWRLFLGLQLSLLVIYIKSYLNCTSEQYGIFITLMGAGSIVGSLFGPYVAKRTKAVWIIAGGLSLHYASFGLLGLCGNYNLSLFIVFISYAIFYMTLVTLHSVRDRITPSEIRASAYGTTTAILTPAAILSTLAGGALANQFSVTGVLFFAGISALVSLIIILCLGKNTVRDLQHTAAG